MSEKSFFGGKAAPFLAACCAILWSCAFPLIKTGLSEFAISSDDTFSQMLFAGVRFIAAGICGLQENVRPPKKNLYRYFCFLVL